MRYIRSLLTVILTYPVWGVAAEISPVSSPTPLVQGSIISGLLQEYDSPFVLYPYESNYIIYTKTSDMNKEAIASYDWGHKAKKDEVKFQISLAFPLWRGIAGENSVLAASYTQRSWWQLRTYPRRDCQMS